MIYCLMTKTPLSDSGRTALFNAAVAMAKEGQERRKIVHDDVMGTVKTKYQAASLVGISGYIFDAEIVHEKGVNHVRYIVRTSDLEGVEDAKWTEIEVPIRKRKSKSDIKPSCN